MTTLLQLVRVGHAWPGGTVALAELTLAIPAGRTLAILGPSGCGKSTLLRLIAGLAAPTSGSLAWAAGAPPPPGAIGMVFQDANLLPWATAAANAALPLRLRGMARAPAHAAARLALDELHLGAFADARPAALSGGMRMRVALARALSTTPALLLMDEPFAALDEPTRHHLQDDLRVLQQARGCTIVFVTHSIYEATYLAHRVAILAPHPGRLAHLLDLPPHAGRLDPPYLAAVARLTTLAA